MGFLAQGDPVAFVGAVRFLAGPTPDSTLALFSVSLANRTLLFRRTASRFEAAYQVEAVFGSDSSRRKIVSDQTVRVPTFAETQGADESVILQQFILLSPGDATLKVSVRRAGNSSEMAVSRRGAVGRGGGSYRSPEKLEVLQ